MKNAFSGPAIQLQGVSKRFAEVAAVSDVNLTVPRAELFGLIGPDGAGKTTLFRMLTTLLVPDTGSLSVMGYDSVKEYRSLRRMIGYMPGRFSLYQDLTVAENLAFYATVFGTTIDENYDLIKAIYQQIEPFRKRRAGDLSGGMKQKLALSCALIHKPELLVLDEPTTGVDAVSRQEFWQMLQGLKAHGLTIVVSTPYMDEAALCDRVALMQKGRFLGIDRPQAFVDQYPWELWGVKAQNTYDLIKSLRAYHPGNSAYPFGESVHYSMSHEVISREKLIAYLVAEGHQQLTVEPIKPGIEDRFMALMDESHGAE